LVEAVASIEAPDDNTVVITMSQPVGTFITDYVFWYRIMPQHIWEPLPDPKTFTNETPVGAGPFKLTRWEKAQFIELDARKDYAFPPTGHAPYIDKVIYRIYPDANTRVLAFQNGDLDALPDGVPVDSVDAVKEDPTFEVIHNPSTGYDHVSFNVAGNPHLADINVRQALASAVDKQTIVAFLLKGYGGVMTTIVSPVLADWVNPEVQDWPFDIEAGKKLLDAAGYTDTDGNGTRNAPADRGGADLEFRLSYSSTDPVQQRLAPILQENWQKLGITITLDAQEGNALYDRVRFEHDFDLWIGLWGITDNPPFNYYNFLHSTQYLSGSNNFVGLKDQAFDDLSLKAYEEPNIDSAKELVKQLQVMEHELVPLVPLFYREFNLAYNKTRWEGFTVLPGVLLGISSYQSLVNVHQLGG
jgi:peptide/nickel transport system substrate-binding protein